MLLRGLSTLSARRDFRLTDLPGTNSSKLYRQIIISMFVIYIYPAITTKKSSRFQPSLK